MSNALCMKQPTSNERVPVNNVNIKETQNVQRITYPN